MKKAALFEVSNRASPHSRSVNTGNMMHAAAGRKIVDASEELQLDQLWTAETLERLNADFSYLVFIAANGIRLGLNSSDASELHARLIVSRERTRCSCKMCGISSGETHPKPQ